MQLRAECDKYSVNDFKVLKKLGEGQFGTVFLVTDPSKSRFFALKCIPKAETVKQKLEKNVIN
jgi:cGMP-dependent protein kinase